MAIFRRKHIVYNNTYMPTSSAYYTTVFDSDYSDRIYEYQRKICFEIGAYYDFLENWKWSFGIRAGFNTLTLFFGLAYLGYNFEKR
jgi:hypothetical protein